MRTNTTGPPRTSMSEHSSGGHESAKMNHVTTGWAGAGSVSQAKVVDSFAADGGKS